MSTLWEYHAQLALEEIEISSLKNAIQDSYGQFSSGETRVMLDRHYELLGKALVEVQRQKQGVYDTAIGESTKYASLGELQIQTLIDESHERIFNQRRARAKLVAGITDAEYEEALKDSLIGALKYASGETTKIFGMPIMIIGGLLILVLVLLKKV